MATKKFSLICVDEDYLDMELNPFPIFSYSIDSPPPKQNIEFEFQKEKKSTNFSSDELFNKEKPLPSCLQMPHQKLLQNGISVRSLSSLEDSSLPYYTTLKLHSTNANNIPLESRKISRSESSRRFSCSFDANPPKYLFQWSTKLDALGGDLPKDHCSKKLKLTKQLWLSQRFKASRDYIKSLFTKPGCSDKSNVIAARKIGTVDKPKPKCKDCQNKYVKDATKKKLFENFYEKHRRSCVVTKTITSEMLENGFINHTRKSFSGVIQRHCASKATSLSTSSSGSSSLSSSFSFSSSGTHDSQGFKRSIGVNSELENSIEAAIAHCKQSQLWNGSNKAPNGDKVSSELTAVCGN
ncbi:putative membrane-associated kinase regulator 4 [Sesbania bispinosa]|nr:putative membrane-associated kinase regulator 4 [Sesbania bispinosa]